MLGRADGKGMSAHKDTENRCKAAVHVRLSTSGEPTAIDFLREEDACIHRLMVPHGYAWVSDDYALGATADSPWYHAVSPSWTCAGGWSVTLVVDLVVLDPKVPAQFSLDDLAQALAGLQPEMNALLAQQPGPGVSVPQLQTPVIADAYSEGQQLRGQAGGERTCELRVGVHTRSHEQHVEDGQAGGERACELRAGVHARSHEQHVEDGQRSYELRVGIHGRSQEQRVEDRQAGGERACELRVGIHGRSQEQRAADRAMAGAKSGSGRGTCSLCWVVLDGRRDTHGWQHCSAREAIQARKDGGPTQLTSYQRQVVVDSLQRLDAGDGDYAALKLAAQMRWHEGGEELRQAVAQGIQQPGGAGGTSGSRKRPLSQSEVIDLTLQ